MANRAIILLIIFSFQFCLREVINKYSWENSKDEYFQFVIIHASKIVKININVLVISPVYKLSLSKFCITSSDIIYI